MIVRNVRTGTGFPPGRRMWWWACLLCCLAFLVPPTGGLPGVAQGRTALSPNDIAALQALGKTLDGHIKEMEESLDASANLEAYRKEFEKALPTTPGSSITWDELTAHLAKATCVVMGDDHSVADSQNNSMRVMQAMARGKKPVTLVLEWIDESYQGLIDEYLAGRGTLDGLRKAISYDRLWGFPWKSYRRILKYAKTLKFKVFLTERLKASKSLQERDRYIMNRLSDHRQAHPGMRYLIVYGEYHVLGSDHLSDKLFRFGFAQHTAIFGEGEQQYWAHLRRVGDAAQMRVIRYGPNLFFVPNGSPLLKKWSYRRYLMDMLGFAEEDFDEAVPLSALTPLGPEPSP